MNKSKVFTPTEVARALQVSAATIYAELERGRLPHQRVGRRYLITRRHLEAYLSPETVEELLGAGRDEGTEWLQAAAGEMGRGISAAEQNVPSEELDRWMALMGAAVKPLPEGQ
jgi:excisionase family DNA binding protein